MKEYFYRNSWEIHYIITCVTLLFLFPLGLYYLYCLYSIYSEIRVGHWQYPAFFAAWTLFNWYLVRFYDKAEMRYDDSIFDKTPPQRIDALLDILEACSEDTEVLGGLRRHKQAFDTQNDMLGYIPKDTLDKQMYEAEFRDIIAFFVLHIQTVVYLAVCSLGVNYFKTGSFGGGLL